MDRLLTVLFLTFLTLVFPTSARAFECVPTADLLADLQKLSPPPDAIRLDPQLNDSFVSGMRELANVSSPVPRDRLTGIILVGYKESTTVVVLYEVGARVCGAVRFDSRIALDILRRGAEL